MWWWWLVVASGAPVVVATDCCVGAYAPGGACNMSNLVCIKEIGRCQDCVVSDFWNPQVECSSCCARHHQSCDDDEDQSLAWIASVVVSILLCVCCGSALVHYEHRRRRDGVTVTEAYRITSPLAEVTNEPVDAAVSHPKPEEDPDIPVAQPSSAAVATPFASPLELGAPVSRNALLTQV